MHPQIIYLIARDRLQDTLVRAERQRLARSAVAARSGRRPARSPGPVARQMVHGGP